MTLDDSDEASWSQFWASGSLTAFYGQSDNYSPEFIAFWRDVLAEPVDRIVDLGCGNGALTWIVDEIVNQPEATTEVCGIDLAAIDPFAALKKDRRDYPKVSFLGETSIAAMPFETDSFDIAVSQYGIEYSDIVSVLPELERVLKPEAKLAFIMHDEQSAILSSMAYTARGIEFLFQSGGYYDGLFRLDKIQNKKKNVKKLQADPVYRKTVRKLQHIKRSVEGFPPPLRDFLMQHIRGTNRLFAKGLPLKSQNRRHLIKQRRRLLEGTLTRYSELTQAALSRAQYENLIGQVEQEGFTLVQSGNFMHKIDSKTTTNMGWILVAER
jgi:ubiquinone/menaquinone biosynthesis C-methylase UbiE